MKIRRNPESGRRAVTLLATTFVVLIGALATAFMVLSMTERATWRDWTVWSVLFGGVVMLLWSLYQTPDKNQGWLKLSFWLGMRRRSDPLSDYQFRRRKTPVDQPLGTNQPPTLESVREAAESSVRWVPHGPAPERSRSPRPKR